MAQTRFIKYRDNITSFGANQSKSGLIPGAVYRGFDGINPEGGLLFQIHHFNTGQVELKLDETLTSPMGIWVSGQGTTIKEDEPIFNLAIETNAGNASFRNDYLIGRHHHDVIYDGGVVATYEIIKGPLNSDTLPADPNLNDWVIIAVLRIPPNSVSSADIIYKRMRVPSLGNQFPALLDAENRFVNQQQEFQGPELFTFPETLDGLVNRWTIANIDGGNLFFVSGVANLDLLPDKPNGTEIQLYFRNGATIRPFVSQLTDTQIRAGYSIGYRPIVTNFDSADNLVINPNQIATFRKVDKGGVYANDNKVFGDFWKLVNVSNTADTLRTFSTMFSEMQTAITSLQSTIASLDSPGTIKPLKLFGVIADYFDESGKGLPDNIHKKWAICNGSNNTPDLRDVKLSGYAGLQGDYDSETIIPIGDNDISLTIDNIAPFTVPTVLNMDRYKFNNSSSGGAINPFGPNNPGPADVIVNSNPVGGGQTTDIRGKRYYALMIMRLPDDLV